MDIEEAIQNSNNKEYFLEKLKTNPELLDYASEELKNDKDVVRTAINSDGRCIRICRW